MVFYEIEFTQITQVLVPHFKSSSPVKSDKSDEMSVFSSRDKLKLSHFYSVILRVYTLYFPVSQAI